MYKTSICAYYLQDGSKLISASADKSAKAYDMATGQAAQVARHDGAIKCCRWVDAPSGGYLVTGSWDKSIKVGHITFSPFQFERPWSF